MIRLRSALSVDAQLVFNWRNDPWIVALSSGQRTVAWNEHFVWFQSRLVDPNHRLFIVESGEGAVGVARLERKDESDALISVFLMRPFTGRGWGGLVIRIACQEAFASWPVRIVRARIRRDNQRSLSAFAKAGFTSCLPLGSCPDNHFEMMLPRTHNATADVAPDSSAGEEGRLRDHYVPLLRTHGTSHLAVDWGSAASQQLRFRALLEAGDTLNSSILDVGCGVGHLLDHLKAHGFTGSYAGTDLLTEMTAAAGARHPEAVFVTGSLAEAPASMTADYVFGSGLFTFSSEAGLREMVTCMYERCKMTAAFNSLSAWGGSGNPGEFHADPSEVLRFCRTLTPWVVLRHDYLPHDFTVYLYRKSPIE